MTKLLLSAVFFLLFVFLSAPAEAQNCPNDWHPPPCGTPPPPVKSWLQTQLKGAEQYHFSAAQVAGVAYAASCHGSTGEPRVDAVRRTVCTASKAIGAFAIGMQQWESRLIAATLLHMLQTAITMSFVESD